MPATRTRALHRLSHLKVAKLRVPGIYEDGGGLRLLVTPRLAKRWVMRLTISGKRRERGLGSFSSVSLEEARTRAGELRKAARQGRDLAAETRQRLRAAGVTFQDAFETYFEIKRQTLSNRKHVQQWVSTMQTYVFPVIGARPIADIRAADILRVVSPIWFEKPETARRVLQRLEAVFKSAILRETRTMASPCIGVAQELGTRHRGRKHYVALACCEVPRFVADLRQRAARPSVRLALEFLILTATRSGEVRMARWQEIDMPAREWRIPADRMKAREMHIVPLSDRALAVLLEARSQCPGSELIFPGTMLQPLSDMTLTKLIRDMGYAGRTTAHGFRASFKVWAAEVAQVRDEVSEAALAHRIPEKVRAAYLRTQFLAERRPLMERWAAHVASTGLSHQST